MHYRSGLKNGFYNLMHLSVWLYPLAEMFKKSYTYNILENSQTKPLAWTEQIKDLGILLPERLSFRDHISDNN